MSKERATWTVIDARDQVMRCKRCGGTRPLSDINGQEVSEAIKIINRFISDHKDCKEQDHDANNDQSP